MNINHAIITLAAVLCTSCGGRNVEPDSQGVPPWNGPPTDFEGFWHANEVKRENDSLAGVSVIIEFTQSWATPKYPVDGVIYFNFGGTWRCKMPSYIEAKQSDDGHGFDGSLKSDGSGNPLVIHARADAEGKLHGEFELQGTLAIDPPPTTGDLCSGKWSFIATRGTS